jgi:stage II sporulation protein R
LKKVLILVLGALLITGAFAACGGGSLPVSSKKNVIRLHILANSDSDADQSLKLKVRDLVLKDWGGKLAAAGTASAAWKELNGLLPDIQKDISSFLKDQDAGYGVELKTGTYNFPSRDYNGVIFPEGKYHALRIELGSGAGHNWWCVMFPPLCLVGDDGDMDMEQYMDLVESLKDGDAAPDAPVRSWLFDNLFGKQQWDDDFLKWAREYWLGGEDK